MFAGMSIGPRRSSKPRARRPMPSSFSGRPCSSPGMTARVLRNNPGHRALPGKLSHRQGVLKPPLAAGPPAGGGGSSRRRRGQVGVPMPWRVPSFSEPPSVFAPLTLLPPPASRNRRKGKDWRAVSSQRDSFQVRGDGPRSHKGQARSRHWATRPCYFPGGIATVVDSA